MTTEELAAEVGIDWDDYWGHWEPTKDQLELWCALMSGSGAPRCAT
jgi:hypothetical protein